MQYVQIGVGQLSIASLYVLIGVGFVTIYKSTKIINFAQGTLGLVAGYFFYSLNTSAGLPFAVAIVLALAFSAILGALLYLFLLDRLIGEHLHFLLMIPIAIDTVLGSIGIMVWGANTDFVTLPVTGTYHFGRISVSAPELVIVLGAGILTALYWLIFQKSSVGLQMQAISQSPTLASHCGVRVRAVAAASWGIGCIGSALAGIGFGVLYGLSAGAGDALGLVAFPAIILGGIDSLPGVVLGAVLLAELQGYAGVLVNGNVSDGVGYLVLLVVLAVRPQGILGTMEATRL